MQSTPLSLSLILSLSRKVGRTAVVLGLIWLSAGLSAGQNVARAESTLPVRERLVEEALQVSQTPRVMEALAEAMIETLARTPQLARLKPEQRARLSAAVGRAYSPRRFVNRIRDLLVENASEYELQEFIRYSKMPLAQRALEMEIVASSAHSDLITRHARASANDPETMQRIAAVRRMDAASGGSDMLLAISVATALSSADMQRRLALEPQGGSGERSSDDGSVEERDRSERSAEERQSGASSEPAKSRLQASKAEVERLSRSLRPNVYRDAINSALFTYRWLTLSELTEYTELQEIPAMRKVASLINDALGSVFLVAQADANEQMLLELLGKGQTPT
jgi:NAD(P)-dependent dehydrogenase (short-subunit alcohol dehydrogenase family)